MNNDNNYLQMRIWENTTQMIAEAKRELSAYKYAGVKEVINSDPYTLLSEEKTVEERVAYLKEEIVKLKRQREEIANQFSGEEIDVEYIVTGAYPNLVTGGWLHNYYIRKIRIENTGYYYNITEQDMSNKPCGKFETLEEAVAEILSYYYYISKLETVEEAIEKLDFL
jgi:uncharacterized small protein (DUF1192 family)